jgi:hypothetical protein
MRHTLLAVCAVAIVGTGLAGAQAQVGGGTDWAANLTAIEACSCPMFCQCYFNSQPAAHGDHHAHADGAKHFCRANLAYHVNKGHHGGTSLDGAKFWVVTDLGDDFSKGEMEWAVLYFDKTLTPAQREAIGVVAGHLFPVKWKSFQTAEGTIDEWKFDRDGAHALLDGGKTAEVRLHRFAGMTSDPVVIRNLKYWAAPRNDGFVLMPNDVEAYRSGPNAFEFKGTNGFMITLDLNSKDFGS